MEKIYKQIPEGHGECPVCKGTGRTDAWEVPYKSVLRGYDQKTDTLPCRNCGGQTMLGTPRGFVRLRRDNQQPCKHEYTAEVKGRCYRVYTCIHCGDHYDVDSGD